MSIYLGFVGVGQLLWGPLSDRYGRLVVLFCTLIVYEAVTIACIFGTVRLRFFRIASIWYLIISFYTMISYRNHIIQYHIKTRCRNLYHLRVCLGSHIYRTASIHTSIDPYIHTYTHKSMHSSILTYMIHSHFYRWAHSRTVSSRLCCRSDSWNCSSGYIRCVCSARTWRCYGSISWTDANRCMI